MLTIIASIGPPIAVISTVLAYFGWSQAAAQAKYMGLNVALFDFADQDYIRFSVGNLFTPLVCLFTVGICVLGLDRWLRGRIETGEGPAVRRIAGAAAVVGVLVAGAALLVVALQPGRTVLYAPYVAAAGVLLAAWATRLHWLAHPGKPEALSVGHRVPTLSAGALPWTSSNTSMHSRAWNCTAPSPWPSAHQPSPKQSSALKPYRSTATTGCACWQSAAVACSSCPTGGRHGAGPWSCSPTTTLYGLNMDTEDTAGRAAVRAARTS
jgi:hypothetical protein